MLELCRCEKAMLSYCACGPSCSSREAGRGKDGWRSQTAGGCRLAPRPLKTNPLAIGLSAHPSHETRARFMVVRLGDL
jgi:hypothetical protein